ncbi:MAG TPA: Ig-like domain-containing protein, partial [Chloroflexia bacterium]|nr:Ig-like domain-containing protein [Chloroflexia bacterium]
MTEPTATPASPPPKEPRNRLLWLGGLLGILLLVVVVWVARPAPPNDFPPRPTATPPPTVAPHPTSTPEGAAPALAPDEDTPTPVSGAATFTPEPGHSVAGPHVLGITAGVGMRAGQVAGVAPIAVTFSEAMDQGSAQAAFALQPAVPGAFTWQANTLLFTPNAPLSPRTDYTVSVKADAKTRRGQVLAGPLAATFKTAPPPAILRTLPSAGAAEVPPDTIVTITFNRPMIPLTALDNQPDPSQWVTISPAVNGRWVWLGTGAVGFHAAGNGFLPSTDYTVEVKAGWPDADGATLAQGQTVRFTTIKPAILDLSPGNGASGVGLDTPLVVTFNQPMNHGSVQQSFTPHVAERSAALPGTYAWSADSTVMTFTPASLLEFSHTYAVVMGGPLQPATGNAATLAADSNQWEFTTTDPTHVSGHNPQNNGDQPVPPSTSFGFYFNNELAPNQNVAPLLTISPQPGGYRGILTADGSGVYTQNIQLLPNTTYRFDLQAGLKDKWGFTIPAASWQVKVGPLPPALSLVGGMFQPIYAGRPTRVRLETTNLGAVKFRLSTLTASDVQALLTKGPEYDQNGQARYPGRVAREWSVPVQADASGKATTYPAFGLDAAAERLAGGFYVLQATAPSPYQQRELQAAAVLMVGRTGLVSKHEGNDLLVWAADLGTGRPMAGYPLRVERWINGERKGVQRGKTGQDGVFRLQLDSTEYTNLITWGEAADDAVVLTTGWSTGLGPEQGFGSYGAASSTGSGYRGALYTDRPIYRPGQIVYFRGVYRRDDDARYSVPPAGTTVDLISETYRNRGQTRVYTATLGLSPVGTFNGQFTLPADAPTGSYSLSGEAQREWASVGFQVEEYRKPDFQVSVTPGQPAVVHGDPVTATVATSYYFGGPLANVTTTVHLQASTYYFDWSDPNTGETYTFG